VKPTSSKASCGDVPLVAPAAQYEPHVVDDGGQLPHQGEVGGAPADAQQAATTADVPFHEQNEKHRAQGLSFIMGEGPSLLPVFRLVIGPLCKLMKAVLHAGSSKAEVAQRMQDLRMSASPGAKGRCYRVSLAARQELELSCLAGLRAVLFGAGSCDAVHPAMRLESASIDVPFAVQSRRCCY
jgi:hypothetical protein